MTALIYGRGRRQRGCHPGGRTAEIHRQYLAGAGVGLSDCLATDERTRRGQCAGVGRVLEEALLAVEASNVEGEAGGREQDCHRDGEND
jgi:hypothetical protein